MICVYPNISAECARRKFTQADLADMLGVSLSTVKNWLRGKTQISSKALIAMSKTWGVSIDYLIADPLEAEQLETSVLPSKDPAKPA